MCLQDLCQDNQADVQEGFVHFFPALLQHLPHTARASFFQTLTQSLSLKSATWRCRIGLADQLDSLSALEVRQPIFCLHGHPACLKLDVWSPDLVPEPSSDEAPERVGHAACQKPSSPPYELLYQVTGWLLCIGFVTFLAC